MLGNKVLINERTTAKDGRKVKVKTYRRIKTSVGDAYEKRKAELEKGQ